MGKSKTDSLSAVLILAAAYTTAQVALIVLKIGNVINWHWAAVLTPTWAVFAIVFGVVFVGAVIGISKTIRQRRHEKEVEDMIEREFERFLKRAAEKEKAEDFIKSLEEGDE